MCGLLSLVVAGCGTQATAEPERSTDEILSDVARALGKVRSYHVEGESVDEDGRGQFEGDVTASGSMRFSVRVGDARARMVIAGSTSFLNANGQFWRTQSRAPEATARLLSDRWVKVPPGGQNPLGNMAPETVAYCLTHDIGTVVVKGRQRFAGQDVVVLTDRGDKPGTAPGDLYVGESGLPLRVVQTGPRRPGTHDARCGDADGTTTESDIRLSAFDEPVEITAPPGALDLSRGNGTNA
jgi:hypothetical protein